MDSVIGCIRQPGESAALAYDGVKVLCFEN